MDDRVKGLKLGNLVKPFPFCQVAGAVRTLLYRGSATLLSDQLKMTALALALSRHRVRRAGHKSISAPWYSACGLLVCRQGEVLSHLMIACLGN